MANAQIKSWSKYFLDLPPGSDVQKRYKEKMNLAEFSEDPYCCLKTKRKGSGAMLAVNGQTGPMFRGLIFMII